MTSTRLILLLLTLASSLIVMHAIPEDFLVATDEDLRQVFEIDLTNGTRRAMISMNLVSPSGVTYDPVDQVVYFIDNWKTVIKHSMVTQTEAVYKTLTGAYSYSLYAEPINRLLYVSEWSAKQIAEYDLRTDVRRVFTTTTGNPWGLIVDLFTRTVYWSQCNPGAVVRATLDNPTNRVVLIQSLSSNHIEALAIDFKEGIMYFASVLPDDGTIESATIDGANRTTVYRGPSRYYQSFILNHDYMYITAHTRSVLQFSRTTGIMTEVPPVNSFLNLDSIACSSCAVQAMDLTTAATSTPRPSTTTTTPGPTTTSAPVETGPCDVLSGRWEAVNPKATMCIDVNTTSQGQTVGLYRQGNDPFWVEVIGRTIVGNYRHLGLSGVWPYDTGVVGFAGECQRCGDGTERIYAHVVTRGNTVQEICSDGGRATYPSMLTFTRAAGNTCYNNDMKVWRPGMNANGGDFRKRSQ